MKLNPKLIIFITVCNYITAENRDLIKNELIKYKILSANKFVEIVSKYFDFEILRTKPIIPEDIWLYNYLHYENQSNKKIFDNSNRLKIKGKFKKTPLLKKYYTQVILPQIKVIDDTYNQINSLTN